MRQRIVQTVDYSIGTTRASLAIFLHEHGPPRNTPRSASWPVPLPTEETRKPNYPIRMKLLNLTQVTATNFIDASIRRHFKNAPPVAFFGLLGGPLTLSMPPSLGFALLFGLFLTSGLSFRAAPALLDGPPFRIAFRLLASRA